MRPTRYQAFSLIELLAVIAIMVILVALLFPAVGKARNAALAAQCLGRMKTLGTAAHLYIGENDGGLPYSSASPNWMVNLAPYLGISGTPKKDDPFTTALLCPDDPARSPRQLRTYRYNAAVLSYTTTDAFLPKKVTGVVSPATLAMFFCVSFTDLRQLELWTFDNAIWKAAGETAYPPNNPGIVPRPHYGGRAVNVVFYDGHAAVASYPLPPATFHFDAK